MSSLIFAVEGKAETQGSTRAFMPKGARFPIITSTNPKLKAWRSRVAMAALEAMRESGFGFIGEGPIRLDAAFYFTPPKSKRNVGKYKDTRGDWDKYSRALSDAMTGTVYRDDSQIAVAFIEKLYGEIARTEVIITTL
jgi:Holliday junction resolvase RusA-like endonuclease